MIKTLRLPLLSIFVLLVFSTAFDHPDPELELRLTRNIGYSNSIGSQFRRIQGSFTVRVKGPANLERVEFFLDERLLGQDNEAPYALQFHTDSYPVGIHQFKAIGFTSAGDELQSNIVVAEIVPAGETGRNLVYILGAVFALVFISSIFPVILQRGKKKYSPSAGTQRNYGVSGGGICSRCQRPFPFAAFSPNLGPGLRITACPYCGKYGVFRRRSIHELRAAEEAELAEAQSMKAETAHSLSEEEKLRKALEDTRFQGS